MKIYSISSKEHYEATADIIVSDEDGKTLWIGKSGPPSLVWTSFTLSTPDGSDTITAELRPPPRSIGFQPYVLKQNDDVLCTMKQTKFWSNEMVMVFSSGDSCTFRLPQVIGEFKGESDSGWTFHLQENDWVWKATVQGQSPELLPCALALLYRQWSTTI